MSPPNDLSIALATLDWSNASALVNRDPSLAVVWIKRQGFFEGVKKSRCLALHEACVTTAPVSTVNAILQAHPDAIRTKETSYSRLPLHCACRRTQADPAIVALLIKAHRAACLVPDGIGRLPIHYALSNGADSIVIHMLLTSQPESAKGIDLYGWSPLHVACANGNSGAIVALLQIYPDAVIFRTNKGSTPAMCLSETMENRLEIKSMLRRARRQFDSNFVNPLTARRGSLIGEMDATLV
jgi:hypothetical protein